MIVTASEPISCYPILPQVVAVTLWWVLALHSMSALELPTRTRVNDDVVGVSLGRLLLPSKARLCSNTA